MIGAGRIERYVLGRTLGAVGIALAVIASVIALVQFVDLSRTVGVRADVGVAQLFWLTLLRCPAIVLVLAPFVFLFGGIGAFVSLNRSSELVAMRAAGVSAWRFILPFATAAFVAGNSYPHFIAMHGGVEIIGPDENIIFLPLHNHISNTRPGNIQGSLMQIFAGNGFVLFFITVLSAHSLSYAKSLKSLINEVIK